jgi:hypothetical protein
VSDTDREAMLLAFSIVVGGGASILVRSVIHDQLLGESLGFVAMWMAIFPFARRTWGQHMSAAEYFKMVALATSALAALRIIFG